MRGLRLIFSKLKKMRFLGLLVLGMTLMSYSFEKQALLAEDGMMQPIQNDGFLLIQKEMLKVSDAPKKQWGPEEKASYRSLLFLESYFLKRGVSSWSMRVLHKLIRMRDNVEDLKKKAFLECEAWRILDYDLKNHENKDLIEELKQKKSFNKEDHKRFRKLLSDKVAQCLPFVGTDWKWQGKDYSDQLYDVKTKNAVESVQTYMKVQTSAPSN